MVGLWQPHMNSMDTSIDMSRDSRSGAPTSFRSSERPNQVRAGDAWGDEWRRGKDCGLDLKIGHSATKIWRFEEL